MSDLTVLVEELQAIHEKYTTCGHDCCAVCRECDTTWPCRTELLLREVDTPPDSAKKHINLGGSRDD